MSRRYQVDLSISDAVKLWYVHGIPPGSCTELLLRGEYDEAFLHAHPLIKPVWEDHIKYIQSIPMECRDHNYDSWKGKTAKDEEYDDLFVL